MRLRERLTQAKVVVACFVLALVTVALAAILPPVALNPSNTDAVAFGKVRIIGDEDGAFINLRRFAIAPLSPPEEGLYILDTQADAPQLCVRTAGVDHCSAMTLVP